MFKTRLIVTILFTQAILLALPMTGCAPAEYNIETEANPEEAGEVTGAGTYEENEEASLKAEPEDGYEFDYWELEGEEVSTNQEYTFEVENDTRLTAHFSARDLELVQDKLDKAEEAINNENWKEAGTHLQEAWELPGAEEKPFRKTFSPFTASEQDVLSILLKGKVVTGEEISEDLKEIDELAPRKPEIEVLDQEPEELYEWFAALIEWRIELQTAPSSIYQDKLICEEGIEVIRSKSEQYLETPEDPEDALIHQREKRVSQIPMVEIMFAKWEINNTNLYYVPRNPIEPALTEKLFFTKDTRLVDAKTEENKALITLEFKETIPDLGIEPGEQYQLTYDIHKKDDGTFRVGDYAVNELSILLDKAEDALDQENWKEAGSHLQKARELPGAEEESFYILLDFPTASGQDVLSMLLEGKVVTGEEISEDLEEIDELAPRKPEIEVLDQKSEELYEWFTALRKWRVNLQNVPVHLYRDKLIHENGIQQIHSRSEQYLEKPVEMLIGEWEINDTGLYFVAIGGTQGVTDRQFFNKETRLIDADYEEEKVYITLEIKETIEGLNFHIEPGEQWQLIYDIHKKDDETFRVGDYAIKDLKKDEIVKRIEISNLDTLGPD